MWIMGQYVASALDATVCNNWLWRGKNGKASKYVEKPFMSDNNNDVPVNDDEATKKAEQFFMQLSIMEANYKLSNKNGEAKSEL